MSHLISCWRSRDVTRVVRDMICLQARQPNEAIELLGGRNVTFKWQTSKETLQKTQYSDKILIKILGFLAAWKKSEKTVECVPLLTGASPNRFHSLLCSIHHGGSRKKGILPGKRRETFQSCWKPTVISIAFANFGKKDSFLDTNPDWTFSLSHLFYQLS